MFTIQDIKNRHTTRKNEYGDSILNEHTMHQDIAVLLKKIEELEASNKYYHSEKSRLETYLISHRICPDCNKKFDDCDMSDAWHDKELSKYARTALENNDE